MVMKRVDDLIREAHKTINGMNWKSKIGMQQANSCVEGRAVTFRNQLAGFVTNLCIKIFHDYLFSCLISSFAAICPEIMDGGTPGPGTVSCPA